MPELPIVQYNVGQKREHSWARWMVNRTLKKNNNNLVSVVGKTGSGKTWSAISICEIMSKMDGVPFTVDNIVFTLRELMDLINSGKLMRGSKIVFDEPQVSISAREYQSQANKVFNYLLSTFRHQNLSLFFCTPFETLLDKNTRRLFHVRFETEGVNTTKKCCKLKARFLEYSDKQDLPYTKRLIVNTKGGHYKISYWEVPKPSKNLIKEYEAKKKAFTTQLNQQISERLKKIDEKINGKPKEPLENAKLGKPLSPREMEVYELNKKGLNGNQIAKQLKVGISVVSRAFQNAKIKLGEFVR